MRIDQPVPSWYVGQTLGVLGVIFMNKLCQQPLYACKLYTFHFRNKRDLRDVSVPGHSLSVMDQTTMDLICLILFLSNVEHLQECLLFWNWLSLQYASPWMNFCLFVLLLVHFRNNILTHWGRDKMDAISQTTFWSEFSWMKMFEFRLKFHWSLFLRVQLTIFQHWFR